MRNTGSRRGRHREADRGNGSARGTRRGLETRDRLDIFQEKFTAAMVSGDIAQLDRILEEIARCVPPSDSPKDLLRMMIGLAALAAHSAIEQDSVQEKLWNLALTDDMTGLHNRRGFFALAEQQLKFARRNRQSAVLFFADIDGLKQINDRFGHAEGSLAITRAAQVLRNTFRSSDVIARLGGDEFAILANEASPDCQDDIWRRLNENLMAEGVRNALYPLSLSIGAAKFDPQSAVSLEELLNYADQAMYEAKRASLDDRDHGGPRGASVRSAAGVVSAEKSYAAPLPPKSPSQSKVTLLCANLPGRIETAGRSEEREVGEAGGLFTNASVA